MRAPDRQIGEALFVEEMLLTRGPYKWLTTIPADKLLIGIFHGANLPQPGGA
ncbi:hypothetical protein BH09CHL1_BH09CHL1_05660 [soil metagenome]